MLFRSHAHGAVHRELEQVGLPRRLHDGQRACNQHAFDCALAHQMVSRPNDGRRLACALLVETKRTAAQRQKFCCLFLMFEWLKPKRAGPLIVLFDGLHYFIEPSEFLLKDRCLWGDWSLIPSLFDPPLLRALTWATSLPVRSMPRLSISRRAR